MKVERQMFPIPIDTFFGGRIAHVDLYLLLNHKKYVKVVKKGDEYDIKRIRNYENKEVRQIFISPEDLGPHVANCVHIARTLVRGPVIPPRNKVFVTCRAAEAVLEELNINGLTNEAYIHVQDICLAINDLARDLPGIGDLVSELISVNKTHFRHAIAVSFMSSLMGHALRWSSAKSLNLLSVGGLLHDIGFLHLPPELLDKETADMTADELDSYKGHCDIGHEIVISHQSTAKELALIVRDHHEAPDGSGFPRGLTGSDIFPLSRAISFADKLCHLLLDKSSPVKLKPLPEIIRYLRLRDATNYPDIYWDGINSWLKKLDS